MKKDWAEEAVKNFGKGVVVMGKGPSRELLRLLRRAEKRGGRLALEEAARSASLLRQAGAKAHFAAIDEAEGMERVLSADGRYLVKQKKAKPFKLGDTVIVPYMDVNDLRFRNEPGRIVEIVKYHGDKEERYNVKMKNYYKRNFLLFASEITRA